MKVKPKPAPKLEYKYRLLTKNDELMWQGTHRVNDGILPTNLKMQEHHFVYTSTDTEGVRYYTWTHQD